MSNTKKHPLSQIESVRLANFLIRMLCRLAAVLIALTARILTSIILAIVRFRQRNRSNW